MEKRLNRKEQFKMQRLTPEQAAIIGAYTGVLCGPFDEMHQYMEKIIGEPIFTSQLADKHFAEYIKEYPKLECYNDGWNALSLFNDLIQKMGEVDSKNISQEQFVEMLLSCGFEDLTEYERKE